MDIKEVQNMIENGTTKEKAEEGIFWLIDVRKKNKIAIETLKNKVYKKNDKKIEVGRIDDFDSDTISIGRINEIKREKNIKYYKETNDFIADLIDKLIPLTLSDPDNWFENFTAYAKYDLEGF